MMTRAACLRSETMKELITALRCTLSECDHEHCRYAVLEKTKPDFPVPADFTDEHGVGWWISCDVDRISREAADALEKLTEGKV